MLADLERRAELVKANVLTAVEDSIGQHQDKPLDEHFTAYLAYLDAKGVCHEHRAERGRQLRRITTACGFRRLADLDRATATLRRAFAAGYRNIDSVRQDGRFGPLLGRADVKDLLAQVEVAVSAEATAKNERARPEEKLAAAQAALEEKAKK